MSEGMSQQPAANVRSETEKTLRVRALKKGMIPDITEHSEVETEEEWEAKEATTRRQKEESDKSAKEDLRLDWEDAFQEKYENALDSLSDELESANKTVNELLDFKINFLQRSSPKKDRLISKYDSLLRQREATLKERFFFGVERKKAHAREQAESIAEELKKLRKEFEDLTETDSQNPVFTPFRTAVKNILEGKVVEIDSPPGSKKGSKIRLSFTNAENITGKFGKENAATEASLASQILRLRVRAGSLKENLDKKIEELGALLQEHMPVPLPEEYIR